MAVALPNIRTLKDLHVRNQPVFIRLDFNVPLSEPDAEGLRKVEDDTRITEALPTIKTVMEKGGKLILASHLGRPDGKRTPEDSLEPVARRLAELLETEVTLAEDCVGEGIELMVKNMTPGQVLLLENLRYHPGEEANSLEFCHDLARLANVYINDAFGTAHRKHASVYGVPMVMDQRGAGLLIEKELLFLNRLLNQPARPFYTILGGSKVSDKIKTIENLLPGVQGLCVGGAMAYAFLAAKGEKVPPQAKQPGADDIRAAESILREAKKRELPVLLPVDTVDTFDIGPQTIELFKKFLAGAKTVFWNGPLGWFEKPEYATGTFEIAKMLAEVKALKVVGGGDTVSAIHQSGMTAGFDHLSTGGGAVLKYLEGKSLPGIDALRITQKAQSPVLE
ncbi:MAG: phosphoglycerate kinase [Bacteriovoracia bacterium]